MSSTRDCPSCGREAGFHQPSCCFDKRVEDELAPIRAKLTQLAGDAAVWAQRRLSPWARQLVDDVSRALGTARWLEGDIERRRIDAEKQARGE